MEVQFLRPDLSHFLLTFIDLFKCAPGKKKCLCKSEHVTRGGTQWAIIRLHPWEVPQLLADLRWYETWWTWWTVQSTHSEGSMQVQRVLLTLLHHKLYPQENVPQVQLISVEGAWQLTRSQVLKHTHTQLWLFKEVKSIFKKKKRKSIENPWLATWLVQCLWKQVASMFTSWNGNERTSVGTFFFLYMWLICWIRLLSTQMMPRSNFWTPRMCLSISTSRRSLARRRGTTFWRFRSNTPIVKFGVKRGNDYLKYLVTWVKVRANPVPTTDRYSCSVAVNVDDNRGSVFRWSGATFSHSGQARRQGDASRQNQRIVPRSRL